MKTLPFTLLALVLVALPPARAELTGVDPDPLGTRSDPGVGFATWDSFPGATFASAAPGTFDADGFSATLSSATVGGMVLTSGDATGNRLYSGGNAFSLSIAGTTASAVQTFALQLKFSSPAAGASAVGGHFSVTLNGLGASGVVEQTNVLNSVGTTPYNVVSFTWTDLDLGSGLAFNFAISSAPDHVVLDAIALDSSVAAVPEPGVVALLAAAAGWVMVFKLRGRRVGG